MKGTEKQLKWATEIKGNVMTTISEILETLKTDPRYDASNAKMAAVVTMWESRAAKLNACEDAGHIIDFFRGFTRSSDMIRNIQSLQAIYKVSINNGYEFK